MGCSSWTTLLLSKIVQTLPRLLRTGFSKQRATETGFGRLRWPSREMGAPQPSPNLSLLSRMADFVSVLRVTDDGDEKGQTSGCGSGNARGVADLESRE